MGISSEKRRDMTRILQQSILQLCNEHVGYNNKLQILGVLCLNIDDDTREVVVKVNNTLKRVPPSPTQRDTSAHAPTHVTSKPVSGASYAVASQHFGLQPARVPGYTGASVASDMTSQRGQSLLLSPNELLAQSQSLLSTIQGLAAANMHSDPSKTKNDVVLGINNNIKEPIISHLEINVQQKENGPQNTADDPLGETSLDVSKDNKTTEGSPAPGGASKKHVGRKARKPTRVDCVYDEGEMIMNEENDFMTLLPTDPDQAEEDVEMRPISDAKLDAKRVKTPQKDNSTPKKGAVENESSSPQHDQLNTDTTAEDQIPRDEQDSSSANHDKQDDHAPKAQRSLIPTLTGDESEANSLSNSSSTIRALLQVQAYYRQQAKLGNKAGPAEDSANDTSNDINDKELEKYITPIVVTPESPMSGSATNCSTTFNGDDSSTFEEQEQALDFSSSANHKSGGHSDDEIEVVRAVNASTPLSHCDASLVHMREEARNEQGGSRPLSNASSSAGVAEDLSQSLATSSSASDHTLSLVSGMAHYAFPRPYHLFSHYSGYPAVNLPFSSSTAAMGSLLSGSADSGGLSIQYTANGPITIGANGQNMSLEAKDLSTNGSPAKKSKSSTPNKCDREGDYVLDHLADDPRKRRRKAPNDTLTAEEIAEYMGASNLPTGRDGGVLFKCKYCSDEIDDLVRYLQHTLTVHNAYICHQCGKSFTTKSSLLRHRPIHTGLRRFACSICKKSFYRKDKCKSHIKRHLGPNEQNIDQYQSIEPVPDMGDGSNM